MTASLRTCGRPGGSLAGLSVFSCAPAPSSIPIDRGPYFRSRAPAGTAQSGRAAAARSGLSQCRSPVHVDSNPGRYGVGDLKRGEKALVVGHHVESGEIPWGLKQESHRTGVELVPGGKRQRQDVSAGHDQLPAITGPVGDGVRVPAAGVRVQPSPRTRTRVRLRIQLDSAGRIGGVDGRTLVGTEPRTHLVVRAAE